jgi:nicotinamide-nucleotide amidase
MNEIVQASIITIGDELMIGQVVDTNSTWLAQQLNQSGIWVRKRVSVGDNYNEIRKAFDEESLHSKIVLITGGLGPTADDITKPFLCDYFGTRLVVNEDVLNHIRNMFENVFKRPFTERNQKQAEVPESSTIIHNARGTAPGLMFEKNGVIFISMPGVPHEMKGMMKDRVLPLLRERVMSGHILHRTLLTAGIGESFLADHIQQWEEKLPEYFKLAYLPNYGMVRLRITGTGTDKEVLAGELDTQFNALKHLVGQWLVTDEDITLPQVVGKMLKESKQTVGTAESCTGGYIAHLITTEPGASDIFNGAVVCYSNDLKKDILHVKEETLTAFGAVSEETVREMTEGAIRVLKTDFAISTSGIMGPTGGSPEKPVGTVWVAVGNKDHIISEKFQFRFDRMRNIELTANNALNLLRKFMLKNS